MTDILSTKEIIKCVTLSIFKGMKNAFNVDILIRNENIFFEEHKTKNRVK